MENEEIYYLLAYDKKSGKWRSADEMLGYLVVSATGEAGPVHYVSEESGAQWRPLEDGIEKDIDFENTDSLGNFLKIMNNGNASF